MYCQNCGAEIDDKAVICPKCGVAQPKAPDPDDKGGFGWGLLGFLIPLVGLILFLVWRDTKPKRAKSAGKGALISVIVGVVLSIISIALTSCAVVAAAAASV